MSFMLTVKDVFTITGRGTVVTGRIEGGEIAVGQAVRVRKRDGSQIDTIVAGIVVERREVRNAPPGTEAGILLRGVERDGLRGAVLVDPAASDRPDPVPDPDPTPEPDPGPTPDPQPKPEPQPTPKPSPLDSLKLGGLTSTAPALLLPLRIETAFRDGTLLIRAFPDQVHIDSFDPALNSAEVELIESVRTAELRGQAAVDALARSVPTPRARYLADVADNGATVSASPSRGSARVRALPEKLVAVAWTGDTVFATEGKPIPQELPIGLDAMDRNGQSGGAAWLHDFAAAEAVGLGLRLGLDRDIAAKGIDRLVVAGLDAAPDAQSNFAS